jgi:hypothetical protein
MEINLYVVSNAFPVNANVSLNKIRCPSTEFLRRSAKNSSLVCVEEGL